MQAGILSQIPDADRVMSNVQKLLAVTRKRRVRTVSPATTSCPRNSPGCFSCARPRFWQGKAHAAETRPLIPHGSAGFQLAGGLEPRPDEPVIDKITMSAFEGTPLDIVLRDCGVRAFLIAGVATEVGIEPTVRHSTDLGYIPIVVHDACGSGNATAADRAIANIAFAGDALLATTDDVCAVLAGEL